MMTPLQQAQAVVDSKTATKYGGVLLDITTAAVMVAVIPKLNATNQTKINALPLQKAAMICWKLYERVTNG